VWKGVANFGRRPTVDGTSLWLEVHLFDYSGDLYGRHLRVALREYLRGERKFDGLAALTAQIAEDAARARTLLAAPAATD
jgi:riboflavin kinase/FMN adenylyltransferase